MRCPHCIVEAGPHRKEEMTLEDAINWILEAKKYKNGYIVGLALTGGEPFQNLDKLTRISDLADEVGFTVSAVTNSFWASSKEKANKIIQKVPAVRALGFSTDEYHQKAVPIEYVENAIWAAKMNLRLYNIGVCTDNREDLEFKKTIKLLREMGEEDNTRVAFTFPVGRGQTCDLSHKTSSEPSAGGCSMAGSPIIFPNGKVIACIGPVITLPPGHPLFLGDLKKESLNDILERAEMNPILHIIRIWGPKRLFLLLKEQHYDNLLPTNYVEESICDCCYKLLSDKKIVDVLEDVIIDKKLIELTAYGRLNYFNEPTMAIRLGLLH
jgi:MoaA/NifB/PqqE/SkfB family radical SAM enzyme